MTQYFIHYQPNDPPESYALPDAIKDELAKLGVTIMDHARFHPIVTAQIPDGQLLAVLSLESVIKVVQDKR